MAYTPLSTDFKDQILSDVNAQRKYKQTVNEDGTVSLLDMTAYDQQGSSYSAKHINEEREAINNIYANKLVSLDEIDLVTEEGYFVDAKAVKELNGKINHNSNKHILIGKWSSVWNLSNTVKNIGSKKAAVDNEYYKTTTGADSTVTVKKSGLYYVSMYAQGSTASGASASIQAQVIASATVVDDAYVLFGSGYSYNGLSANINMGRVVFLQAGTVLTPQIRKSSASGAASTTGSSYMEVVHIY